MSFTLRAARPADGPAIAGVKYRTWAATYTRWVPDVMDGFDLEAESANWARYAVMPGTHVMLTVNGATVLAFCASGPARPVDCAGKRVGAVYAIYVEPDRHGGGIGQALMADAVSWLAAEDYPEAILWVAEPSTRSRSFYEQCGFILDEGVTDPWRGIMTVRYRRSLP